MRAPLSNLYARIIAGINPGLLRRHVERPDLPLGTGRGAKIHIETSRRRYSISPTSCDSSTNSRKFRVFDVRPHSERSFGHKSAFPAVFIFPLLLRVPGGLLSIILLALMATAPAQAQTTLFDLLAPESIQLMPGGFSVTLTGQLGIVGVNGWMKFDDKTDLLNIGFPDITKNVGPLYAGTLEIGRGPFFLMSDVMYATLSPSVSNPILDGALNLEIFSTDILAGYRLAHARGSVDFFAGGRYTSMDAKMDLNLEEFVETKLTSRIGQLPPRLRDPVLKLYPTILATSPVSALFDRKIELSPQWIDLLVGTRVLFDLGHGVRFAFRGEAGGLIAFMFDVRTGLDFRLTDRISAAIDYRYVHYGYERKGGLMFRAGMTGPAIALQMKF